ncbi:hypothetical protein [Flavobacterium sp. CF136]|uniref:hypothetical protein n=1 Tax=Flavobacterium sp. (strain CF136) TaxID=1144313 RepID=UPI0002719EF5|nr:hypothetical protein [Flavobacterium sp. CF136]EJL66275.1 hypothetical protein PMI10_00623 [Flavobacterium sp. CF136]
MKKIENVTLYKCDFCKKELKRKHAMDTHEKICNCNPENKKACMNGCIHLEKEELDVDFESYYDYGNEEQHYSTKKILVFKCAKLDKLMFPWSIERKNLHVEYPSTFEYQEPMPKKCSDFSTNPDTSNDWFESILKS